MSRDPGFYRPPPGVFPQRIVGIKGLTGSRAPRLPGLGEEAVTSPGVQDEVKLQALTVPQKEWFQGAPLMTSCPLQ